LEADDDVLIILGGNSLNFEKRHLPWLQRSIVHLKQFYDHSSSEYALTVLLNVSLIFRADYSSGSRNNSRTDTYSLRRYLWASFGDFTYRRL